MKKYLILAAVTVVLSVKLGCAADATQGAGSQPAATQASTQPLGMSMRAELLKMSLNGLNLTEDQQAKIKGLNASFLEDVTAWNAGNKSRLEQIAADLKAAGAARDQTKQRGLLNEYATLARSMPKQEELDEQIAEVLTPEQKVTFKENLLQVKAAWERNLKEVMRKSAEKADLPADVGVNNLDLSEEQKTKVKEVRWAYLEKSMAWNTANRDQIRKLEADVMAASQAGNRAKILAANQALMTLFKGMPRQGDLDDQIAALLTPEQKEKFEQNLAERNAKEEEARREQLKKIREQIEEHQLEEQRGVPAPVID